MYIGFVDSDDYIDLDMYEVLAKNAKAYNADISVVGCNVQQHNGNWVIRSAGFDNTKFFKGNEAMDYFIEYEFDLASMCDKLFKKTVIGELRLKTDMKMNEDVDFVYRCYRKCEGVAVSDKSKYYYRYNQSSCTHKGSHSFDDMLICMDNIYLSEKKVGKRTDVLNRQFCKAMLASFNVCVIQNKRHWSALKSYIQKFHKSLSYFTKDDYKDMSRKKGCK